MRVPIAILASTFVFCLAGEATATPGPLDLSTGSTGFGSTPSAGAFSDPYTFIVSSTSLVSASVISAVNGLQDVDFGAISISGPGGVFSFSQARPDPIESWVLPAVTLTPGSYTLRATGINSAAANSYGGSFAVAPIAAVTRVAPQTVGPQALVGLLDLSSGSSSFFNTPVAGSFADTFAFSLVTPGILDAALTSVQLGAQDIDFTSIDINGPAGHFLFSPLSFDPFEAWALDPASTNLIPGMYTLTVRGINSAGVGSYGGMLALSPNAAPGVVPEPDTVALLAVAGLLGMAARRRRGQR
ncbi:MAG: FxDxF family PEP-CTERM protein [Burkholderiaceae bacterium]